VLVIDSTREMMASNVISQPLGAIANFSVIVKICKYRGHHFISMAMKMHSAPECEGIISLGNVCLFMIDNQEVIYCHNLTLRQV
jgi:hypothetical protein